MWITGALLFLTIILPAFAEDTSLVKKYLFKVDHYSQVIAEYKNTTEALNRTNTETRAELDRVKQELDTVKTDVQALKNQGEVESRS